ncbi:MAG: amino acid adenylation domain-containing protein [Cloacibacillus sp.]
MQINLVEYLEKTASRAPNRTAIIEGDGRITFATLSARAKALAEEIVALTGGAYNRPIAVFISKSIKSVVADIAATYSGNIYMNIDPKIPSVRLQNILQTTKPALIITDTAGIEKFREYDSTALLVNLDELKKFEPAHEEHIFERLEKIIDTDPYCIINTSGSTGTPKGVVLNHKSFIDFTEWAQSVFNFSENEVIGSLSPNVFDIYSYELCLMASKGATMAIIPDGYAVFPIKILDFMETHKVTFCFWVPTIMVNIANMDLLAAVHLSSLKLAWFAGEVFPTKQFNYWRHALPCVTFANLYGPIEITLDCTYYVVDRELKDDEPIPIGFPCRNTDILILNEQNEMAASGEDGELCVRGTSLAMGYYNNPERTAAAFTQNPLNSAYPETIYRTGDIVYKNNLGEIIFKGRRDSLIKHMGYRIELGEIEHVVVNTLKIVDNACVVYNFSKKAITLIYESKEEKDVAQMRKKIGEAFPKYMIPAVFISMQELPRNTNGKIDRLKLSKMVNEN